MLKMLQQFAALTARVWQIVKYIRKVVGIGCCSLAIAVLSGVIAFAGEAVTYAASPDCCEVFEASSSIVTTASSAPGKISSGVSKA